jgi:hypothetical protein
MQSHPSSHAVAVSLAVSMLAGTLMLIGPAARADQLIPSTVLPAPVGHLQPRANGFATQSGADRTEQHRLHAFDALQGQLDKELDQKLNVCRC